MNKLKRRFPNFVAVEEGERTEHKFEKFSELLNVDWIKNISGMKGFKRFSVGDRKVPDSILNLPEDLKKHLPKYQPILMAEFDKEFWGIGYFDSAEGLEDLPDWRKVERENE